MSGYDLDVSTYSPEGRVYQVEYAEKAVHTAPTALAIVCQDGVLFGMEKQKLSKLLVDGTNKHIMKVHESAGLAFTGLTPDGRQVVNRSREEAQSYKKNWSEVIPPRLLAERLGSYMHVFTLYGSVRPFGCSVLLGAVDHDEGEEASLFCVEPSGEISKWNKGHAIGKERQLAKTEIEKLPTSENGKVVAASCRDSMVSVARIIHKVHDEKDRAFELEMAWVCKDSGYKFATVPKEMLKEAETEALRLIEAEDEDA
uniref:Proteasome subunit alpha type n=1 Tax=Noctiluca scintillans TaxID=2966 RepID=A0A7S1F9Z9_NOCSC